MKKKVLVTGAGGFIGSHLTEHLVRKGYSVKAFVRYNSSSHWGWLETSPLKADIEFFGGDIRDFDSVYAATEGVDRVYHLGALIAIPYSYQSPLAYIRTNVEGTYNVLECARKRNLERVMVTSTSEVYGTAKFAPITEEHPSQPQSPYSASKIAADNISLSYSNSFGTPVVVARPFNTYGPRQSARAIIPTVITQLLQNPHEALKIGNLSPTRDLTFVEDTVRGMEAVMGEDSFLGRAVNIGNGREISMGDLIEKIGKIIGVVPILSQETVRVRPEKSEVMRLLCDATLLTKTTDWTPSHTLDEGLHKSIEWLKANLGRYKPSLYNI